MKTNELTGLALDWAVAKCEGKCEGDFAWYYDRRNTFNYSTDWAQGGPIIEREGIAVWPDAEEGGWFASADGGRGEDYKGPTPLIAAMRCYVAFKLGGEVDVPKELT